MSCEPPSNAACAAAGYSSAIQAKIKFVAENPAVLMDAAHQCTDKQLRKKLQVVYPEGCPERVYRVETRHFAELEKGPLHILSCKAQALSLSIHVVRNSEGTAAIYFHFTPGDGSVSTWLKDQMGLELGLWEVALGSGKVVGSDFIRSFINRLVEKHVLPWSSDEIAGIYRVLVLQEQLEEAHNNQLLKIKEVMSDIRKQIQDLQERIEQLERGKKSATGTIKKGFEAERSRMMLEMPKIGQQVEGLSLNVRPARQGGGI